jgi:SWI/SNF-related matrix-associated actin-dependent regulator 1 of chromatin subfamily A
MRATSKCPHCKKVAEVVSEKQYDKLKKIRLTLKCGHTILEKLIAFTPQSRDAKWLDFFPYQRTGIEFIEKSNFKALIADEMGLGKTIQALGIVRYNLDKVLPVLYVCKASLIFNWMREHMKWVLEDNPVTKGRTDLFPIPVMDGTCTPLPGFKVYVLSMDLLSKLKIKEWIQQTPFQLLVIDESHNFKNTNSKRTSSLNEVTGHIPYRVCLSGTPILNNALEYFPTLNLIRPEHFPSRKRFIDRWIDYDYETKRYLGLKRYQRDEFFEMTSKYVIRREKKDVLKDLPPMRINEQIISSFDRAFANAYNKALDELDAMLDRVKDDFAMRASFMDILAMLSKLRHITGMAKVQAAFEYAQEFLDTTPESSKLCIGIHHKDVAMWLGKLLEKYEPVMISGADSAVEKQKKENLFRTKSRLAIVNTLAVGEGRNFQFCANFIVVESQWNQAKEDQFCGRFQRPIKCECGTPYVKVTPEDGVPYYRCPKCNISTDIVPIQGDYLLAVGTIDEFFSKMKQLKSKVCSSTLNWNFETDYHAIYELAREVVNARMKVMG